MSAHVSATREGAGAPLVADVAVIGAGLAGCTAATLLARQGLRVALVDSRAVYPPDFRAEKLGAPHLEMFGRVGLEAVAVAAATPIDSIDLYRAGRPVGRHHGREYGFHYADLVNGLRAALPPGVETLIGRVEEVSTSADIQSVSLPDGRSISARLLVVATGLGDAVKRKLGLSRHLLRRAHSLSVGFFLEEPAARYPFESLAYYGTSPAERLAYLTLFPIGDRMRANMFVYRDLDDPWTRRLRSDPSATLAELMPALREPCRGFKLAGAAEVRPIDLTSAEGFERDGFVLVGDAFMTSCPAPGVGMRRVLTDVERLCERHIPVWLGSPGMSAGKIASFYRDPVKLKSDQEGLRLSLHARAMAVDPGLVWTLRRSRNALVRRGAQLIGRRDPIPAASMMAAAAAPARRKAGPL